MTIEQLDGLYFNAGQPRGFLSQIIWPGNSVLSSTANTFLHDKIEHKDIKFIKVTTGQNSVVVKAITENCVVYQKGYTLGTDFTISNGNIHLLNDVSVISRGGGDPLVGPSIESASLSLDIQGNAIYKNKTIAAGLAYLLIPLAISDTTVIRFKKFTENKLYKNCFKN